MYQKLPHLYRLALRGFPSAKAARLAAASAWIWLLSVAGCWVSPVDLSGKPCPCAEDDGFVCDKVRRVCVLAEDLKPDSGGGKKDSGAHDAATKDAGTPKDGATPRDGGQKDGGVGKDAGPRGCDGVPNSGKVPDACGVCGGDSSSCGLNDVCEVANPVIASGARIEFADRATNFRCSANKKYRFGFNEERELELRNSKGVVWSTGPTTKTVDMVVYEATHLILQMDSNFLVKTDRAIPRVSASGSLWGSGTNKPSSVNGVPHPEAFATLTVTDDGHVVIVAPTTPPRVLWSKP